MESSIRSADRPLTCPSVLSPEGSHNMLSKRQQNGGGGNRTRVLFPPLFEGDQVSCGSEPPYLSNRPFAGIKD